MAVMVSERRIEALRGFDSPTVMNAVERFAVRDRTASSSSPPGWSSRTAFRRSSTSTCPWICGLTINPGDLLHGDESGLLTVPAEIADRGPEQAQAVLDVEAPLFELLERQDVSLQELLDEEWFFEDVAAAQEISDALQE